MTASGNEADTRRDANAPLNKSQATALIRCKRFEQRIAEQRTSFGKIADAVEKAGFWKAARAIRTEAEAAITRMEEQNAEMETFYAERDGLADAES